MGLIQDKIRNVLGNGFYFLPVNDSEEAVSLARRVEEWSRKVNLREFLKEVLIDLFLHGNAYHLIVPNKRMNDILRFIPLNPENVEYITERSGLVALDEFGLPIGFKVRTASGSIEKIPRFFITHFKFISLPNSFKGISPLIPLLKTQQIRLNIEDATGEVAYRYARPLIFVKVGREGQRINIPKTELQKLAKDIVSAYREETESLTTVKKKRYGVIVPYWIDIDTLEMPNLRGLKELIDYYIDLIFFGFGTPKALKFGSIEGARTSLSEVRAEYERNILYLQEELSTQFHNQVLRRLAKLWNVDESLMPKLQFYFETTGIKLSKARILGILSKANLLTHDLSLENFIRRQQGLPLKKEEKKEEERSDSD